jgi:hypothetical protein
MKFWKELKWGDAVSSYMFEQMVLNCLDANPIPSFASWQARVLLVLQYLRDAIMKPVMDPKGIQGDLNELNQEKREDLSLKAFMSSLSATKAIEFEGDGDNQKAIKQWSLVFGEKFPEYGA